ncbi:MAG: adenylate cyclase [Acidimicrobiaceae bacterium]
MRVDRAFAFVDLCGFTAFTDRHGDDRVVLVLAELRTALRESAARRGVRVVKWLGDGAMLSSTMIDAIAALTVEIDQRMTEAVPSLAIRAGLSYGPVIMFEGDDYIGRSVNLAARLCDRAQPHELLATSHVAAHSPSWVVPEPAGETTIAGFHDPVDLCRLSLMVDDDNIHDPVCRLTIPTAHAYAPSGPQSFCSEACAGSWSDQMRGRSG